MFSTSLSSINSEQISVLREFHPIGSATKNMNKTHVEHVEASESGRTPEVSSVVKDLESLTAEHREYLLRRPRTFDLNPVPSIHDADPYSWLEWKVCCA
ncbi:hypothetical protein BJX64DRAFT_260177 [Aspergillus heterothallicus]